MKDVSRNWNDEKDEELADDNRDFYLWEDREFALTFGEVRKFMDLYVDKKSEGCRFNIITQYYCIIDGWLQIGRPREPYWTELKEHKPKNAKQRMKMRQAIKDALKRMFEKEDYMESWRKRMRRLF